MDTYLLTWNPDNWPWVNRAADVAECRATGKQRQRWSCGGTRSIPIGARVFLIQVGKGARGLIGSGRALSEPAVAPHWDPALAATGKTSMYVEVEFDVLADEPLVLRAELDAPPFAEARWSPQNSGIRIPQDAADALEGLWAERSGATVHPDDLPPGVTYVEGAAKTVTVNAYERDPRARAACLRHHGSTCCVCGMTPEKVYGPGFEGLIHVHHLTPISTTGEARAVDPVKDLRPVCPNCHAALHRKNPPYTPEEMKGMLKG